MDTFEDECVRHAQIKRDLRRYTHSDLATNIQSCKCSVSRKGYANHVKGHHNNHKQANDSNLTYHPAENTCGDCNKVYRSSSDQEKQMVLHRRVVGHTQIQSTKSRLQSLSLIYAWYLWNQLLVSRAILGAYVHLIKTEAITSDAKSEEVALIWVRCGTYHVSMYPSRQLHNAWV